MFVSRLIRSRVRHAFALNATRRNTAICVSAVRPLSSSPSPSSSSKNHALRWFSSGSHSDFDPQPRSGDTDYSQAKQRIQVDVENNDVMLFMKGDPDVPMCGFSRQVSLILQNLKVPFSSSNVLADAELREAIKEFSDWPTIPQLYVKGEFVGGCDIVTEMFKNGELQQLMETHKIIPPTSN